jgi:2-oxoglutarate ferredoxin oxidoreductase subunit beta
VAISRPDLAVFVVTGDGDALSIGGNHLIHAMRRNVNLTIILFNNEIYGLTKGQYSPTSQQGLVTKSSPMGSVDYPFNPLSVALGAGCSFVGRAIDSDRKSLDATIAAAAKHRGTSFVEVYQNCPIFNDGAYDDFKGPEAAEHLVRLVDGEPILLGADQAQGVVRDPVSGALTTAAVAEVGIDHVLVHDSHRVDPSLAFELSHLTDSGEISQTPVGIFRDVTKPAYDDMVRDQLVQAAGKNTSREAHDDALQSLLNGVDTWTVGEDGEVHEG